MKTSVSLKWALVTGASSGIGEVFTKRFARENWNVILTARSDSKLNELAGELESAYGIETLVIAADLRVPTACREIFKRVSDSGIQLDCLVNNAGFGTVGDFSKIDVTRELEMVDVNVKAVLELTHLFLPQMFQKKQGTVINVSSTASFQPIPYLTTYSATKAFVTSLSEALWYECKQNGVHVLNFCPGRTKTNFARAAGQNPNPKDFRPSQTSEEVVEMAFKAMKRKTMTLVTNPYDDFLRFFERFLPRKTVISIVGKLSKRMGYR